MGTLSWRRSRRPSGPETASVFSLPPEFAGLEGYVRSILDVLSDVSLESATLGLGLATLTEIVFRFHRFLEEHDLYSPILPVILRIVHNRRLESEIVTACRFLITLAMSLSGENGFLASALPSLCPSSLSARKWSPFESDVLSFFLRFLSEPTSSNPMRAVLPGLDLNTLAVSYQPSQVCDLLLKACKLRPTFVTSSKYIEMFRVILPLLWSQSGSASEEPWEASWADFASSASLASLPSPPPSKKGAPAIPPGVVPVDVLRLPFETQCELVNVLEVIAPHRPAAVANSGEAMHRMIEPMLFACCEQQMPPDFLVRYVKNGLRLITAQDDALVSCVHSLLSCVIRVVRSKFQWAGVTPILDCLTSLVLSRPVCANVVKMHAGDTLVDMAHSFQTPSDIHDAAIRLVCAIMEGGCDRLTVPGGLSAASLGGGASSEAVSGAAASGSADLKMSVPQYKLLLRNVVVPIALQLGKQSPVAESTLLQTHWDWLMESVSMGFAMDLSVTAELFLALKALLVRGEPFLTSWWPRVIELVLGHFRTPQREQAMFFLEFLEFLVVSHSLLSVECEGILRYHLRKFPTSTEIEREIVGRIAYALDDTSPPPNVALLEEKVRGDSAKMM